MFPHSLSHTHTHLHAFVLDGSTPVLAIQSMENEDLLCKLNEKTGAN